MSVAVEALTGGKKRAVSIKTQCVSMLCVPTSSDVLMTSPGTPHLHLSHPALTSPVSFSFHLIKRNLWFGTSVAEFDRFLPSSAFIQRLDLFQ